MKNQVSMIMFFCVAVSFTVQADSFQTPAPELLVRIKSECGFDLQEPFSALTTHSIIDETNNGGFRAQFDVRPKKWAQRGTVQVVFNCSRQLRQREATIASDPVRASQKLSAAEIVKAEDAGGRYARHVALERAITAKNWTGTVAYVDSLFGDGQRTPMTMLLACDSEMSRSCVEINVNPNVRLDNKKLEQLLELIRGVAHAPY